MNNESPESPAKPAFGAPATHSWQVLLVFAATAIFLYWPAMRTPFIFDDDRTVSLNPNIMHLWPADWLLHESRPIGSLTFALNYQLSGMSLEGFHLTNTAIFVLSAWMLFLLLSFVLHLPGRDSVPSGMAKVLAFATALLWLVHPLNTQAVSYIAQRYESQMALCFLSTLYCLARGSQAASTKKWWYLGAVVVGSLGMGTKEVMATILLVGPLFDRAFLANTWREVWRKRGWVYASLVPSLMGVLYLQRLVQAEIGSEEFTSAGFGMKALTPWQYFRTQPEIILHYIGLALIPRQLIFDYFWPVQNNLLRAGISGLTVTAIFVGAVVLYIRRPRWGIAGLSFFLILGPTSSFMPIADLAVEHRMHLPLISICVAAVFLVYAWLERLIASETMRQRCLVSLAAVAIALLSLRTFARNEDYRQPVRLFAQCVKFNPANRRAYNNLGLHLESLGLIAQARQQYETAIKVSPTHIHAYFRLGILAAGEQKYASALKYFSQIAELQPKNSQAWYCSGLCHMELGQDREAIHAFESALQHESDSPATRRELAWVLATSTDPDLRDGKRALELAESLRASRPNDLRLMEVLAAAQAETGEFQLATSTAESVLATAEKVGWAEPKKAAVSAALAGYRAQLPLRRTSVQPGESRS